ncbi:inositol 1,4,5-trisphosphate/ryanodine receptor-domain-containing protein [Jimgerdemannia flammicorona]|uniref:Inositol 1,4,5-trisphosphate/ryanodine receptor-domain-containing protein n=1 Tax=Jimgerdemannia flammicorona TaxID=994334 RepID=A0A433DLC9_9FUNG|nr:inositol 1,4,5-trisphosphate/ryanodine receptor-domain-containing protein [Jimgerdemannia flammicorona]
MSAQPQEQFLRVGDNIFLFDDESRALTTENPIDTRVLAKTAQGSDTFPREAVGCSIFRIEPQQSFTARKELLKAVNISSTSVAEFSDADTSDYNNPGNCAELQPDNLPSASWLNAATSNATTVEEVHELEDLRNLAAKEHAQNEAERRRLHGKPVLYGQMIRLYNAHFRKYVSVNPAKSCELATGHLRVDLTREPGGYFRIMPRFKIRVEGEPVRLGDTGN